METKNLKTNKLLSILLVLVMALGMFAAFPTTANAAENYSGNSISELNTLLQSGDVKWIGTHTLEDSGTIVVNNNTLEIAGNVTFMSDVVLSPGTGEGKYDITGNLTVNANLTVNTLITIEKNGSFIINNGTTRLNQFYIEGFLGVDGGTIICNSTRFDLQGGTVDLVGAAAGSSLAFGFYNIGGTFIVNSAPSATQLTFMEFRAYLHGASGFGTNVGDSGHYTISMIDKDIILKNKSGIKLCTLHWDGIKGIFTKNTEATKSDLNYSINNKVYNGKAQPVPVTPKEGVGAVTVKYNGSTNVPVKAGTYSVTADVAKNENFDATTGIALGTYTIQPADIKNVKIPDQVWTGTQRKATTFVYNGISFPISSNASVNKYGANKNIGKGSMTLTGKGNYKGTATINFNSTPKKNSVSKATAGKKQMNVSWKKVSSTQKVTKYQIRYRVKGTSAWVTKTYAASKSSATIKKLTKGKQYEVQVRSYKKVSGANYYSPWSASKTTARIK